MSRTLATGMLAAALLLGVAAPVRAVERSVRPDADPTCLMTTNCYLAIGLAVADAQNGDIITIGHNGGAAYSENVIIGGRSDVTFRGQPGARPTIAAIAADDAPALSLAAGADRTTISHLAFSASPDDAAISSDPTVTGLRLSDSGALCSGAVECLRLQGPSASVADTSVSSPGGVPIRLYQGGTLLRATTTGGPLSIVALSPQHPAAVLESSISSPATGLLLSGLSGTVSRTVVNSRAISAVQVQGSFATWSFSNSLLTTGAAGGDALDLQGSTMTTLRNATIVGPGRAIGILTFAPAAAQLTATNTALRGGQGDVFVDPGSTATPGLTISNSSLRGLAAGSAAAPISGGANLSGDPRFAGPADFHPLAGSPLVDAGAAVPGGDLDLDGVERPRGLAPDIGAYESPFGLRPVPPPPPAPVAPPPASAAAPPRASPRLLSLSLRPATFRAAASGPSVRSGSTRTAGSIVTFRLDVDARVTFTAQRRSAGVRSGGRCVVRAKRIRGPRCTRYVAQAGSFARTATSGTNSLRFTGRLSNRRLPRGTYRLRAKPRAGDAAAGPVRDAAFTITR